MRSTANSPTFSSGKRPRISSQKEGCLHGIRYVELAGAPLVAPHAEGLGLQGAAQALRQAASGAADYNLAMQGCSAHEMPLPSSASVAPIGRLHLDTTEERLNDPGPCHTVVSPSWLNSYLPA